ncbi:winged helix-turn-helix domain-containing protein [Sciscionella sediminilitoris]|uniref:winged helix-turn-helix domain-containing protein n=1 Tax=Sciscionella sediminilitoris TaxID=1445613 RepID=UPI0004DED196|nr:winged helix-turn-helix domain-containing protein [Sciscionella sp. SE31]
MLLVEPDEDLVVAYRFVLREAGLQVDAVEAFQAVEPALAEKPYDAVVFDRRLLEEHPSGYLTDERMADWRVPIVLAYRLDDGTFVVPDVAGRQVPSIPPSGSVVTQRTVVRPSVHRVGELEIDTERREVHRSGELLSFTRSEFDALALLAANVGDPVPDSELLHHVWSDRVDPGAGRLPMLIDRLRRKLRHPVQVKRVPDYGYLLSAEVGVEPPPRPSADERPVDPVPPSAMLELPGNPFRPVARPSVQHVGDLEIDTVRREVHRSGELLPVTSEEFDVLALLAEDVDRQVSEAELTARIWSPIDPPAEPLAVLITRLNRKLRPSVSIREADSDGYVLAIEPVPASELTIPVTVYLSEESAHREVQTAVEDLIQAAGADIVHRDRPVLGSWFRRMWARMGPIADSELGRIATHTLESRLVLEQDATVTATMMQHLGPLLAGLQNTRDAVIRVGALLIVKADWAVSVHQLTAEQQLVLDHHPQLLTAPHEVLDALRLPADAGHGDQQAIGAHPPDLC